MVASAMRLFPHDWFYFLIEVTGAPTGYYAESYDGNFSVFVGFCVFTN